MFNLLIFIYLTVNKQNWTKKSKCACQWEFTRKRKKCLLNTISSNFAL